MQSELRLFGSGSVTQYKDDTVDFRDRFGRSEDRLDKMSEHRERLVCQVCRAYGLRKRALGVRKAL